MDKIEKVIYINLAHRTDRRLQIEQELSVFPGKVVRFDAIRNENGAIGCTMSHIAVLEMAIRNGWKNYLVVEDDMVWTNYSQINLLNELINKNPDVIVFSGYNPDYNAITYKLNTCQTTTSFLVFNKYYDTLLSNFKEGLSKLQISYIPQIYAIDRYWKLLQQKDNWYIIPNLCIQRPSYSDIEKRNVNYNKKKSILDILKGKR